jgi:hypothetical protein
MADRRNSGLWTIPDSRTPGESKPARRKGRGTDRAARGTAGAACQGWPLDENPQGEIEKRSGTINDCKTSNQPALRLAT